MDDDTNHDLDQLYKKNIIIYILKAVYKHLNLLDSISIRPIIMHLLNIISISTQNR